MCHGITCPQGSSGRVRSMTVREVKRCLVIDVKATSDDERAVPRDEVETLENGAVLVRAITLIVTAESHAFVRSAWHPLLTPCCKRLDGSLKRCSPT